MSVDLSFWDWLVKIPDPRNSSGKRYSLQSILALIAVAMLNGQTSLRSISRWGRRLSRRQLELFNIKRGNSPSQTTMHYLLVRLDPVILERTLGVWLKGVASNLPGFSSLPSMQTVTRDMAGEYRVLQIMATCCATLACSADKMRNEWCCEVSGGDKIAAIQNILQRVPASTSPGHQGAC